MLKFFKKLIIFIIILCLLGILAFVGINLYVKLIGERHITTIEDAHSADAVIILGAAVNGDTVSYTLEKRLDKGIEVYSQGKAKKILVSGDHGQPDYNEVQAMKNYLIDKGIPEDDIFMDHAGFSTYDTVYRAREIFLVKKAIIVTQKEHLIRALYIADRLNLEAAGIEAENYEVYEEAVQKPREWLARIKAFLQCDLFHPKPKFLGETIPVSGSGSLTND